MLILLDNTISIRLPKQQLQSPQNKHGNQTNIDTWKTGVISKLPPIQPNPTHHQDTLLQLPRAPQPPPLRRCCVGDFRARPTARAAPQRGASVLRRRDIKTRRCCQRNARSLGGWVVSFLLVYSVYIYINIYMHMYIYTYIYIYILTKK